MDIVERIRRDTKPGEEIPKPDAKAPFHIKGWGMRRGEPALIYTIPNRTGGRPYEKGITESEFFGAYAELKGTDTFTRSWFNQNMPACAKEGGCNFTTIGGLLGIINEAQYEGHGTYRKI